MKKNIILIICMLFAMLFSSCGSDSYSSTVETEESLDYYEAGGEAYEEAVPELNMAATDDYAAEGVETTQGSLTTENAISQSRKIIYTSVIEMQSTDYDSAISILEEKLMSVNGYVSSKYAENPTYENATRYATYTLRIPVDNYSEFMNSVGDIGHVLWSEELTEDVTLEYIDIESRLKSLNTERDSLLTLLEEATSVEEIIVIQQYLGDLQYEIENYSARQRGLDDLIQFCTVTLTLHEVKDLTPTESSFIEEVGYAISSSASNFVYDLQDFIIGLIYAIPTLIILALIAFVIVIIVRKSIKKSKKKAAEMQKQHAQFMQEQQAMYGQNFSAQGNMPMNAPYVQNGDVQADEGEKEDKNGDK